MSARRLATALLCLLTLVGCLQTSPRLIKIGLVAPFEGRYREIGVDVIPAARLAVREWAEMNADADIAIELVAYDDAGDPSQAEAQARKVIADPDVAVVIGHWRDDTTMAALPIYNGAGIPLITLVADELETAGILFNLSPTRDALIAAASDWGNQNGENLVLSKTQNRILDEPATGNLIGDETWGLRQFYNLVPDSAENHYFISAYSMPADSVDPLSNGQEAVGFVSAFEAGSLGAPPGLYSSAAYEATWVALDWIAQQYDIATSAPMRNSLRFGDDGRRAQAPIYLYQWKNGQRTLIEVFR